VLEGHTVSEVFRDEQRSRMIERLNRNFAGETVSYETEHKGRVYWTQQAPLHESIGQAIIVTLDITERKQMEDALRQSEERFVQFMEHLPGLAWIKDTQGRYVYANAAAEEAFSTPRQTLYGKTDQDVFPRDVATQFETNDELALLGDKGVQVVETLEQDDGVLHYSLVNKFPIPGPDGNIALIGGTAFDITERKQAEEALRRNEKMFSTLVDSAPFGVYFIDSEFRLRAVNKGSEAVFSGIQPLIGRDFEEIIHIVWQEPFATEVIGHFRHTLLTGESFISPPIIEERANIEEIQSYDWQIHRITLADGTFGVVCYFYDLSEQKRLEATVRASEERYRNLFDLVPVAVYSCDADGLIQEYNHRAVELWGREPAKNDPKEKYCGSFNIYYPDGRLMPHETCPMARMLKGEPLDPHELEIVVERPDGTRRSVIAHPLPIRNGRGEIIEAINCLYDITERKQAEDALQLLNLQLESRVVIRTAELQDANMALHESRKRLQILSQRLVEVQEEERRAIARELHDRVGQSLSALNINLIIMRDQLSPDSLERVGARLADSMHLVGETITLVRDVMSNLRPAVLDDYGLEAALQSHIDEYMSRYEIKVVLERPTQLLPRLGPSIEMTFLRIAQEALMNIARHANASQVILSLWQEGESVCMTIQDNGSGIVSWQNANRPGSHGLTIMRERAEAFGGNLKVGSVPGKGTRIEMSIPLGKGSQNDVQKEMLE
jgi:PAS domain S-box-containing protein